MTPRLVSVGEVLWDIFPEESFLGGAPANVAFHAASLGADSFLVSAVGVDALGARALSKLAESGIDVSRTRLSQSRPTGTVRVEMRDGDPEYHITEDVAWDELIPDASLILSSDLVCFGTLAFRNPESLRHLCEVLSGVPSTGATGLLGGARRRGPARFYDLNLRAPFTPLAHVIALLEVSDFVKLNESELDWFGRAVGSSTPEEFLLANFPIEALVVTCGPGGARLVSRTLRLARDAFPSTGLHPVGAGDSFLAAFTLALARGVDPGEALTSANRLAAWVSSVPGAMPRR